MTAVEGGGRGDWNNKTKKTVLKMLGETKVSNFQLERKKTELISCQYLYWDIVETTQIHHISYSSPVISLLNIWETKSQKINENQDRQGS